MVALAAGRFGGALSLDGNGDWLGMADDLGGDHTNSFPTAIPTNGSYTISVWIKPNQTAQVTDGMIGWGNYGIANQVIALRLSTSRGLAHYWWGNDVTVQNTGTDFKDGDWHHVLAVYDSTSPGNDRFLYVNGKPVLRNNSNNALDAQPENFRIGTTAGLGELYDGLLDDVAVYNIALSASEIEHLAGGGDPQNLPAPGPGLPVEFFTAPFGPGGSWNLYTEGAADLPGDEPITWYEAHTAATNRIDPLAATSLPGHLVAITSPEENYFITRMRTAQNTWIGLTDDDLLFGATESGGTAVDIAIRRTNGWAWVTGEPFSYNIWSANQPDDAGSGEDGVELLNNSQWNDDNSGIPGSGQENGAQKTYVVEWEIQAPAPIPGATILSILPPEELPGPPGENGVWGARWVRNNGAIGNIDDAVASILSGTGTILETNQVPVINAHDPDTPADINRGLFQAESPYFANQVGVGEPNFAVVYKGTLMVENAADYTFGVHSDDGFALRIRGFDWTSTSGLGSIDPSDPETFFYPFGTGDSNSRGVINLPVGAHAIEFVTWNGTGGQYHELYAAEGAYGEDVDTTAWELVGAEPGMDEIPALLGTNIWEVWMTDPGADGALGNTNTAWAALTNYLPVALGGNHPDADGSNKFTYAAINFGNGNQGDIPADNPYPLAGNADMAMFARSTLEITQPGTYALGFRGDDGGWMQVIGGTPWNELVYEQDRDAYIDGDKIVLNIGTGNSRMFGTMDLTPGNYEIQTLWWQGNGGFYWEVLNGLVANGRVLSGLMDTNSTMVSYAGGLQLVTPPGDEIRITRIRYDAVTDRVTITWNSTESTNYALIYSSDGSSTANFDPTTWTDLSVNIPSGGMETSVELADFLGTPWSQVNEDYLLIRVVEE